MDGTISTITPAALTSAVSLLAALSVATERAVEIVKGSIPWLNNQASDKTVEGIRQTILHLLAAACGFVTAWMAGATLTGVVPGNWGPGTSYCIIGLLVSGGSGFWNSILSYAKASKDIQEGNASGDQTDGPSAPPAGNIAVAVLAAAPAAPAVAAGS